MSDIEENLSKIVGRLNNTRTQWKVKASTYANDVTFLLFLMKHVDGLRVEAEKKLEAIAGPPPGTIIAPNGSAANALAGLVDATGRPIG